MDTKKHSVQNCEEKVDNKKSDLAKELKIKKPEHISIEELTEINTTLLSKFLVEGKKDEHAVLKIIKIMQHKIMTLDLLAKSKVGKTMT